MDDLERSRRAWAVVCEWYREVQLGNQVPLAHLCRADPHLLPLVKDRVGRLLVAEGRIKLASEMEDLR